MDTNNEKIDQILRRILNNFDAEKIILFGSHAKGREQKDSDVDLLVIMDVSGSKRKIATEIDFSLLGVDVPVDVIVTTTEEVERYKDIIGTLIYSAVREGKVLYERRAA